MPRFRWTRTRKALAVAFGVLATVLVFVAIFFIPKHEGPGQVTQGRLPDEVVRARGERQEPVAPPRDGGPAQILFGDLHVHTTFSVDAFAWSLPMVGGEGAHPPADACDFARFCADLDFFALTDHAESLTPRHWQEVKESIRQCNAVAGDAKDPDLVAFTGFEWTQMGLTPDTHYGHRNIVFEHTADDRLPARPIAAGGYSSNLRSQKLSLRQMLWPLKEFPNHQRYLNFGLLDRELASLPDCPQGVDTRELPADCVETANTPQALFEKLGQWGVEAQAIPHGTTWGFYTPPGSDWGKQLGPDMTDPKRQRLFEVYSGHGNSEEYRPWRSARFDDDGEPICPEPTDGFEPCCWRAGEIVRNRCGDMPEEECEARVREARRNFLRAGTAARHTVPGSGPEAYLDCSQCTDCFLPAFNYRPGNSAQYVLAKSHFDDAGRPTSQRFGFVASSDNHNARPGTGYKEYDRRAMTEARGPVSPAARDYLGLTPAEDEPPRSEAVDVESNDYATGWARMEFERQASFYYTGGLVAVHADGRSREAIWSALQERRVYGTSGDRILLWFDLLNPAAEAEDAVAMGGEARVTEGQAPRFRVRASGAFEQKPGCPRHVMSSISADRLASLCHGECYRPGDRRRRITRIEVIRVRPQVRPDEPIGTLVEDPWRSLPCPSEGPCEVTFEDPDLGPADRLTAYYVRAIQEPTEAVNGGQLRCERNARGECTRVRPCYGDYRTDADDDCLETVEERAWSSPIWVQP
ncbi:MAG: DUF3604 domain-containing protein [Myxococcota bacterium]